MRRLEQGCSWISKHLKRLRHIHGDHKVKPPSSSSCLQLYEAELSSGLLQLVSPAETGSKATPSLSWAQEAVLFLINAHNGFQSLAKEINHPFEKWGSYLIAEYLADTLNLLDLLNTLSRNLSLIYQHSFSLLPDADDPSLEIPRKDVLQKWVAFSRKPTVDVEEIQKVRSEISEDQQMPQSGCEEERVLCKAMEGVKSVSLFVMKTLSCCIDGDVKSMLGLKLPSVYAWSVVLINLQMVVHGQMLNRKIDHKESAVCGLLFQEVVDVNEHVGRLLSYISSSKNGGTEVQSSQNDDDDDDTHMMKILIEDMRERVALLVRCLDTFEVQIETLFSLILRARNELLDTVKRKDGSSMAIR